MTQAGGARAVRKRLGAGLLLACSALTTPAAMAQDAVQAASAGAPATADPMAAAFRDPPVEARPRVWWHWMNGNITKDGIAKDLDWMKRIGIGGVQTFDANMQSPQIVDKRLVYMTPEWNDAFRFAASEADRLGLELTIASSPGWSETGGPWVPPQDALKKLVWSEIDVAGGRQRAVRLPLPPSVTGPFQSIAADPKGGSVLRGGEPAAPVVPPLYADVAVLAWPVKGSSTSGPTSGPAYADMIPAYTDALGTVLDGKVLTDADLASGVALARPASGASMLLATYRQPVTLRSATLFVSASAGLFTGTSIKPALEASDDGVNWRAVADIPVTPVPTTVSFAPVRASHFRVAFNRAGGSGAAGFAPMTPGVDMMALTRMLGGGGAAALAPATLKVADFRLSAEPRIDHAETKAGYVISSDYFALHGDAPDQPGIPTGEIINLTDRLRADGSLDWTPRGGRWRILRLGYSLVGTTNHPATPEATGLEVDKFDGAAVRRYLEHYLDLYRTAAGPDLVGQRGVRAILTDSIEVGAANWTPQMIARFRQLRGYDPVPWLPALTGTIVVSRTASDRFLYDYRRTLADLMAREHYGTIAAVAHENGLQVYGEALESKRPSLGDDMAMRRYADVPMAALWTYPRERGPQLSYLVDMRGAASVAHIYGRKYVAAESMTSLLSPWAFGPRDLKRVIDLEFATGINRPVIHTSVHAPTDDRKPGLSLFIFGQYFNRHEAWGELARPWIDYIARNAMMLQQGRNVADVAYFYGEEAPLTGLYSDSAVPDAPKAYGYDFVNADALMDALRNDGADLVTPGGARYRTLYLGGSSRMMTLAALRKLDLLVTGGATIIGPRPIGNPGMVGSSSEFDALADKLWPVGQSNRGGPSNQAGQSNGAGPGRVIAATDVETALGQIGIAPDFRFTGGQAGSEILFQHRELADGHSYFLSNRRDRTETIEARFRVTGKLPELWDATTGQSAAVSYRMEQGETIVPLTLAPDGSIHVVFRQPTTASAATVSRQEPAEIARLDGQWHVAFEAGRGAPPSVQLPVLAPLDEHADPGVRYFSGIATYTQAFNAPKGWRPGTPLWLDLGDAREIAEVSVNGKLAGHVWHAPYRIDIGAAVKRGSNRLQVRVGNLWVNRMIGDAQPGATKITWTASPTYTAKAPLRPSGLIGPVRLLAESSMK